MNLLKKKNIEKTKQDWQKIYHYKVYKMITQLEVLENVYLNAK